MHVVYVKSRSEAWLPTLAEIRERVSSAWRAVKAREANETFYQSLRQRYKIVVKVVKDVIAKDTITSTKQ